MLAGNEQGLALLGNLKNVRPEPLLIEKQMYKISCKSSAMFVQPEPKYSDANSRSLNVQPCLHKTQSAVLVGQHKQFVNMDKVLDV